MMYAVAENDPSTKTFKWTHGGFQDARASNDGAEWYIENVFEYLDHPNEFYYSPEQKRLYMYHNGTGAPGSTGQELVVTHLETLLEIKGTQALPVTDISITGVSV